MTESPASPLLRHVRTIDQVQAAPVLHEGTLYWATSQDGRDTVVHAASPDGAAVWSTTLPETQPARIHVDATLGVIVSFRSTRSSLVWLDRRTGAVQARTELEPTRSSALVAGAVYVALADQIVVDGTFVPRAEHAEVLRFDAPGAPASARWQGARERISMDLHAAGSSVLVACHRAQQVHVLDPDLALRCTLAGGFLYADAEGMLLAEGDALVRTDLEGRVVFRTPGALTPLRIYATGVQGDAIVVHEQYGPLRCFARDSGVLRWTATTDKPHVEFFQALAVGPAHAFVLDGDSRLTAFALEDGAKSTVLKVKTPASSVISSGSPPDTFFFRCGGMIRIITTAPEVKKTKAAAKKPAAKKRSVKPMPAVAGPLDLAARMGAWVHLFRTRGDIEIVEHTTKATGARPAKLDPRIPEEVRQFAASLAQLTLAWRLAEEDPSRFDFRAAALNRPTKAEWTLGREFDEERFDEMIVVDDISGEQQGVLALRESGVTIGYENASTKSFTRFESFEAYLTTGAKRAFTAGWQANYHGSEETLRRLLEASVDPDGLGEDALVEQLEARGADPAMARALTTWLGGDVVALLPID